MIRRLHDLVSSQAARRPEAVAVVQGDARLTYGDLERWSDRLARALHGAGCAPGDRVCLFLPKSPWAIVGMVGVMKAGCVYVPIDIASPPARVARVVAASAPACALVTGPAASLLSAVREAAPADLRIGWLDEMIPAGSAICPGGSTTRSTMADRGEWGAVDDEGCARSSRATPPSPPGLCPAGRGGASPLADLEACDGPPPPCRSGPETPAHLLFTSGSTGQPKGVVITHGNVLHFVAWATRFFGVSPSDRTSGHAPIHFDLSTFDIYVTLAAGAALHQVPPETGASPHALARFIRESALTQWLSVPSALAYMARFDVVAQGDFPSLRRVLWCGEVLPTPVLRYWMARLPHVQFTNLYGPTEATVASAAWTVPACPLDDRVEIPIGLPCDGEEILVLDDSLRPVPRGRVGQIYIRGVGLSPGYYRDPERTAEVFVSFPARGHAPPRLDRLYRTGDLARVGDDGLPYFVGRVDSQIKCRGHRVELGEVERAASALPGVGECAVIAIQTGGFEGALICCAFAAAPGEDPAPARLRGALGALLPAYMLPSRWMRLDALPRNANGKIDRRALEERFRTHEAQALP